MYSTVSGTTVCEISADSLKKQIRELLELSPVILYLRSYLVTTDIYIGDNSLISMSLGQEFGGLTEVCTTVDSN